MHELPVVETILETCLKHAQKYNAGQVRTIFLEVGNLSDLEDKWMQHFFDYVSKGTIAQGAKLDITRIPVGLKCAACGHCYTVKTRDRIETPCPECQHGESTIVSGHEYFISNMEIMTPES